MKINKLFLIFLISISVVFVFGCISDVSSFQGKQFSFDYQNNWNITNETVKDGSAVFLNPDNELGQHNDIVINIVGPEYALYGLNGYKKNYLDTYGQVYPDDYNNTLIKDPNFRVLNYTEINVNGLNGFIIDMEHSGLQTLGDPISRTKIAVFVNGSKSYEITLNYSPKALNSSSSIIEEADNQFMTITKSFKPN